MRNNKWVWLLVLVFALTTVLAGCGGSGKQSQPSSSAGSTSSPSASGDAGSASGEASPQDLPPYEVVMTYMANDSDDLPLIEEAMSKITKEKINATVKLQPINAGAWNQQVNLMLAGQEKVDVIMTSSYFGYTTQVSSGYLLPLDDLIDKHGHGIKALFDDFVLDAGKIDGKQYAIPTNKDMAGQGAIIMRQDLAEKYNIDVSAIRTLDDLDAVFETIKQNEPNMLPVAIASPATTSPVDMIAMGWHDTLSDGNGVLPGYDNGLIVENPYENPVYLETLRKLHDWYKKGYFAKEAATNTEPPTEMVKAEKAFSFFNTSKVGSSESQTIRIGKPMIAVPLTDAYMTTSFVTNFMHSIPRGSKDPERAMMFIDLLYTDKELINLLNWGIEGTHYVKVSGEVIDYPEGVNAQSVKYTVNNQSFMFGNQFLNYIWPNQLPDIWEQTDQYNKLATPSKALGFTFDANPVKTEIGAINNVKQQYKGGLESGTLDPDKVLPEFLNRLQQAGFDKVIAEKQRQLDEWAKASQ